MFFGKVIECDLKQSCKSFVFVLSSIFFCEKYRNLIFPVTILSFV